MNINIMDESLIAVCGTNCSICRLHLRTRRQCLGCRGKDTYKPVSCIRCVIKDCELRIGSVDYCYECEHYPCIGIIREDKRCFNKFGVSPMGNLDYIQHYGIDAFIASQKERWTCKKCGSIISIQKGFCDNCSKKEV